MLFMLSFFMFKNEIAHSSNKTFQMCIRDRLRSAQYLWLPSLQWAQSHLWLPLLLLPRLRLSHL